MNLNSSEGANLLNIQYGVVFGAIFTFCFDQVPQSPIVTVAISSKQSLPFFCILGYFFLDWMTANVVVKLKRNDIPIPFTYYLFCTLAIWFLGSLVVLMRNINTENSFLGYRYMGGVFIS